MQLENKNKGIATISKTTSIQQCALCMHSDPETKAILDSLLEKFIFNKSDENSEKWLREDEKFQSINFHRLLNTIFGKKYNHFKSTLSCSHLKLKQHFCQILKCSSNKLDHMSDQITWKRSKYSYHIDVLNQQVKTFPRLLPPKKAKNVMKPSKKLEKIEGVVVQQGNKKLQTIQNFKTQAKIEQNADCNIQQHSNTNKNNTAYQSIGFANGMNFDMNFIRQFNEMNFVWAYPYQPIVQNQNSQLFCHPQPKKDNQK